MDSILINSIGNKQIGMRKSDLNFLTATTVDTGRKGETNEEPFVGPS